MLEQMMWLGGERSGTAPPGDSAPVSRGGLSRGRATAAPSEKQGGGGNTLRAHKPSVHLTVGGIAPVTQLRGRGAYPQGVGVVSTPTPRVTVSPISYFRSNFKTQEPENEV